MTKSNYLFILALGAMAGLGSYLSTGNGDSPPGGNGGAIPMPHKFNVGDDITAKPFLPPDQGGHIYRIIRVNETTYTVKQVYPDIWDVTQDWGISATDEQYMITWYLSPAFVPLG